MFVYQGFKCVKTENDLWEIRELTKDIFYSYSECTKYIDKYLEEQSIKAIVTTSLVTLIIAVVLVAGTFIMK